MHILYFHQYFSTPNGSAGLRSYEFARALLSRSHKVTMVCASYDGSDTGLGSIPFSGGKRCGIVDGINVIELSLPYSNSFSFIKRIFIFARYAISCSLMATKFSYDILFATSTPLTIAIPGIIAKIFRKKTFILEIRDLWPELPRAMGIITNPFLLWFLRAFELLAYRCADACIGLSPGIIKGIVDAGVDPSKTFLIPNGCDSDFFHPKKKTSPALSNFGQSDFVAIYSGTHGIANGLDTVIHAATILKNRKIDHIKFLFIGRGKTKRSLLEHVQNEKLDSCHFIDPLPKAELSTLISRCDICLMILSNIPAFYYGTSPNKFFDYIACGKPVLNNYPGWIADMINSYKCGIVVPPEKPEAMAAALETISYQPKLLDVMGNNSLSLANNFNRKKLSEEFCKLAESFTLQEN